MRTPTDTAAACCISNVTRARRRPARAVVNGLAGLAVLVVIAVASTRADGAPGAGDAFSFTGARVLQADGTLAEGIAVVIAQGRIERFARADDADLPRPVALPARFVLAPGLIELAAAIGAHGETLSMALALDPALEAVHAVDPTSPDLRRALESGVTAALLTALPVDLVGGVAVTYRTAPLDGALDVVRADGPLVFGFGDDVLSAQREPTSASGAAFLLGNALAPAGDAPRPARVGLFLDGRLPGVVFAGDVRAAEAALPIFRAAGRVPAIVVGDAGAPRDALRALGAAAAAAGAPVVVGPLDFLSTERQARAAAELAGAGARIAFAGGQPAASRHTLRVSAALAVRHGLDAAAARRALSRVPAEIAGVADRIGAIEPGKDADLVIFSDDPLRLDATVQAVYIRGARQYRAAATPTQEANR